MKVVCYMSLYNFRAWGEAREVKQRILEQGKAEQFEALVNRLFNDSITEIQLNSFLIEEQSVIYEILGIDEEIILED